MSAIYNPLCEGNKRNRKLCKVLSWPRAPARGLCVLDIVSPRGCWEALGNTLPSWWPCACSPLPASLPLPHLCCNSQKMSLRSEDPESHCLFLIGLQVAFRGFGLCHVPWLLWQLCVCAPAILSSAASSPISFSPRAAFRCNGLLPWQLS